MTTETNDKIIKKHNFNILKFIKKEIVLTIAFILAIISSCIIRPDEQYHSYIDWDTLLLLFSLMAVMAGFQKLGVFRKIGSYLLSKTKHTRQLAMVLVFLPFSLSMFITNDVALITFVPFAITTLRMCNKEKLIVPVIVMQTIAANLGSIIMPMGSPQNLYLYAKSGMELLDFILLMLPYFIVSFICLFIACLFIKKEDISYQDDCKETSSYSLLISYFVQFVFCLLCVAKVIPAATMALIVIIFIILFDKDILKHIDYSLLLTFICLFIFIGNMGRIDAFCKFLNNILSGNEVPVSVASSQIISNVPTAILLSGFSDKWNLLIIGANIGGLGTLISSMANLISYKQLCAEFPHLQGKYLKTFTIANIIMLVILSIIPG